MLTKLQDTNEIFLCSGKEKATTIAFRNNEIINVPNFLIINIFILFQFSVEIVFQVLWKYERWK